MVSRSWGRAGNGGTGGGAYSIYTKATNGQAAVFTDTVSRDAYFSANPDELAAISSKSYMVGVGTTPEDPSSVVGISGWYAYNAKGLPKGWQSLATVLRGEKGEKGDPGSTPAVLIDFVNQPAHGFANAEADTGLALTTNSSGDYVRADRSSFDTTANVMLAEVTDANNFIVILAGYGVKASHGLADKVYYLADNGTITPTMPTSGIIQELFRVVDVNTLSVNIGQPHEVITAEEERDKLQTLTGGDRLDANAVKNLPSPSTFEKLVDGVASEFGISSGSSFTNEASTKLFSLALGTPVTVRTTNGRVNGTYGAGSPSGIWCAGGNPPTGDGAFIEVIIPAGVMVDKELCVTTNRASSTGTRRTWLYQGDPTNGGTEIPSIRGRAVNTTTTLESAIYDLSGVSDELRLIVSRVFLRDLTVVPSSIKLGENLSGNAFSNAFDKIISERGYGHAATMSFDDVDRGLEGLGMGAYIRRDAGRIRPLAFSSGVGRGIFGGNDNQDETTSNAAVVEIVIPRRGLTHSTVLDLGFLQVSTGGNDRTVNVYYGDPATTPHVKAIPVKGTSSHGSYERVIYNVSTTPDALGELGHDIHIVIKRACLITAKIFVSDPNTVAQGELNQVKTDLTNTTNRVDAHDLEIVALRGDDAYNSFSTSNSYSEGDKVYRSNRNYRAKRNISAGAWNANDWDEMSISNCTLASTVVDRFVSIAGNSLHLTVDEQGNILHRGGTHTANDVGITRVSTGDYEIVVGGHVFDVNNFTSVVSVLARTPAQRTYSASSGVGGLGSVGVWTYNSSGTSTNCGFNISIYW